MNGRTRVQGAVQGAWYMFSALVQPAGIGHTVRMGRLLPPTTGEERVPLHRRMPYGPYSLASYLRRLHPRPLHGSGGLRSAPRGEADPVREGRLHLAHPGAGRASPGPQELGDHEPGRKAARHPSRFHDERFQRDHGPRRPKLTLTGHAVIMCRRHAPAAFLSYTGPFASSCSTIDSAHSRNTKGRDYDGTAHRRGASRTVLADGDDEGGSTAGSPASPFPMP